MKTLPHNFALLSLLSVVVIVIVVVFLFGLLLFGVFGCQAAPSLLRLLQTMTIVIKSEKSKRLLSLKIAHQNGINIVEGGRGAATTLRGVNVGLPSINLSAKFFISPPKKQNTRSNSRWNMECFSLQGHRRELSWPPNSLGCR